jgi:hypothetical protein
LDKKTDRIGFRRVQVIQTKLIDEEGLTFLFEINNIRLFCGGQWLFSMFYFDSYIFNARLQLDSCRLILDHVSLHMLSLIPKIDDEKDDS